MPRESNPGALAGEQLISLAEPFGGWVSPISATASTPHFVASIEGVEAGTFAKQNTNQYAESAGVSLFQIEKFGHMGPGPGFSVTTDVSSYVNALALNGDTESGGSAILVLSNGRLVQLASGGASTSTKYDPINTGGTARTGITVGNNNDIVIFRDYQASPVEWAVYSYDYTTSSGWSGADIGIIHANNITSSPVDNFYSQLSSAATLVKAPHKITIGPDGNIYFTDGPYIRQIVVGATAALTSAIVGNVLQLGPGWTATGICAYKTYIAIIASSKIGTFAHGRTRVFLWDGTQTTTAGVTSTAAQYIYDLPDNFGKGIFNDGNALVAMTAGRNNSTKIFELNSRGFEKIFESPFINLAGTPVANQGSIDVYQDGLIFVDMKGDSFGHVFRYYDGGFHDEAYLSDGDNLSGNIATSVGMCKNLFTNIYFVGVNYSSTYKIYYRNPSTYQTSTAVSGTTIDLRSILYTSGILGRRQYPMGFKMTIDRMKIFLSQWGSGSSIYLSAFRGYDSFLPGNSLATNGGVDLLNILIDTNTNLPNGFIAGLNPGNYNTGYYHFGYPAGTDEIDLSTIDIVDCSSFYINVRWTHTSPSALAALIRRIEMHVAQSQ